MKRAFTAIVFLAAAAMCFAAQPTQKKAEEGIALPQSASARDPRIRYSGRWDTSDGKHPKCSWSGSAVTVMLQGTRLNAKISTTKPNWGLRGSDPNGGVRVVWLCEIMV